MSKENIAESKPIRVLSDQLDGDIDIHHATATDTSQALIEIVTSLVDHAMRCAMAVFPERFKKPVAIDALRWHVMIDFRKRANQSASLFHVGKKCQMILVSTDEARRALRGFKELRVHFFGVSRPANFNDAILMLTAMAMAEFLQQLQLKYDDHSKGMTVKSDTQKQYFEAIYRNAIANEAAGPVSAIVP